MTHEIRVRVKTGTIKERVEILSDGRYLVAVRAKRERGAANLRTRELLAKHFRVLLSRVNIRSGHISATKTVIVES
jgi:uncharacterized protein YggU (UPF0235/DUF167 family)